MIDQAAADYRSKGYAHLPGFVPREVCTAILARMKTDLLRQGMQFASLEQEGPVAMQAGDAVLYQGVHHRHGRTMPNPNRWSAHLFLHWVARNGPYADHAFDGQPPPAQVEF